MFIGEKKIARPFRWGIVGGGRTSGVWNARSLKKTVRPPRPLQT